MPAGLGPLKAATGRGKRKGGKGEGGTLRAFVAVEVPQTIRERVESLLSGLKETGADVRWVRPEGVHLTLKFFGSVPRVQLEEIQKAIHSASAVGSFRVALGGLGTFPSTKAPRVIWVDVVEGVQSLVSLQEHLEARLEPLGFPRERRSFTPHATVGRVRSLRGWSGLRERLEGLKDVDLGNFRVGHISLMESRLHPGGARYHCVYAAPLGSRKKGEEGHGGKGC